MEAEVPEAAATEVAEVAVTVEAVAVRMAAVPSLTAIAKSFLNRKPVRISGRAFVFEIHIVFLRVSAVPPQCFSSNSFALLVFNNVEHFVLANS